jgi:hypothetical protein
MEKQNVNQATPHQHEAHIAHQQPKEYTGHQSHHKASGHARHDHAHHGHVQQGNHAPAGQMLGRETPQPELMDHLRTLLGIIMSSN